MSTPDLKKWLDVPAEQLKAVLGKYILPFELDTVMEQIESIAHVTYEKEPEKP